jgi:hypothetical protein
MFQKHKGQRLIPVQFVVYFLVLVKIKKDINVMNQLNGSGVPLWMLHSWKMSHFFAHTSMHLRGGELVSLNVGSTPELISCSIEVITGKKVFTSVNIHSHRLFKTLVSAVHFHISLTDAKNNLRRHGPCQIYLLRSDSPMQMYLYDRSSCASVWPMQKKILESG